MVQSGYETPRLETTPESDPIDSSQHRTAPPNPLHSGPRVFVASPSGLKKPTLLLLPVATSSGTVISYDFRYSNDNNNKNDGYY